MISQLMFCAAVLWSDAGALVGVPPLHVLVGKGHPVGNVGSVVDIGPFDLAGPRQWTATVHLDSPGSPAAVLKNGRAIALWGAPTSVPGVYYSDFYAPQINDSGGVSWPGLVEPILINLSGLFLGGEVALLGGDPGLAPGFAPGLTYRFFQAARLTDDEALVACDLTSPSAPFHQALVRLTASAGGPPAQSVLAQEGEVLPGTSAPVAGLPSSLDGFDTNRAGNVVFLVHTEDGVGHVFVDDTIVISEEDPLATLGLPLDRVSAVNLNDGADWSLFGQAREATGNLLDVLLVNGAPILVEGDPVPGVPGFSVVNFHGGELTNDGRVLWHGYWDDPDSSRDEGLFLGDQLLVQEGVTVVEGQVVTSLGRSAISDGGQVLLFSGGLGPGGGESDNLIRMILP